MSKHEFRDEDGNIVDPSEIESGGYEVVDDVPAADALATANPAPKHKGRRVVAVSAAVIALLAGGGGAAYVLTSGHNDAPAPAATSSSNMSSVAPSSTPSSPSSLVPAAANGVNAVQPPLLACQSGVDKAAWPAGDSRPNAMLKVIDSVQLPPSFSGRVGAQLSEQMHRVQILQTGDTGLGIYWDERDSPLSSGWWKVSVETGSGRPVVAGEGRGAGGDKDFPGACTSFFKPDTYLVVGSGVPGAAQADQPGQIPLSALKVDASSLKAGAPQVVWAVARDKLLKTELMWASGGSASSSSSASVSTTPATGEGER